MVYGRADMMLRATKEVHEIDFWWTYLSKVGVGSGDGNC